MSIPAVRAPAYIECDIDSSFIPHVSENELKVMKALAGSKVSRYKVTPHQAYMIASVAGAVISLFASVFFSSLMWISFGLAAGITVYCYFRKDMDNPQTRQKEKDELFAKTPLVIASDKAVLADMIEYDLGSEESFEERCIKYVKFKHLESSYDRVMASNRALAKKVEEQVRNLSREAKAVATDLKELPLLEAKECVRREVEFKATKSAEEKNLQTQRKNLLDLERQVFVIDSFQNPHNIPREQGENSASVRKDFLKKKIQSLEKKIENLDEKIRDFQNIKRQKEMEVSNIDARLREALTPLSDWEWTQYKRIDDAFSAAKQRLESQFALAV